MKKFRLYWRDGMTQVVEGNDIADAFSKAGYGGGAIRALDFHGNGDKLNYEWHKESHSWRRICCEVCNSENPCPDCLMIITSYKENHGG